MGPQPESGCDGDDDDDDDDDDRYEGSDHYDDHAMEAITTAAMMTTTIAMTIINLISSMDADWTLTPSNSTGQEDQPQRDALVAVADVDNNNNTIKNSAVLLLP